MLHVLHMVPPETEAGTRPVVRFDPKSEAALSDMLPMREIVPQNDKHEHGKTGPRWTGEAKGMVPKT
jgi:hypothetical protein